MKRIKNYIITVKGACTEYIPLTSKPWQIIKILKSKGFVQSAITKEHKLISFTHPDTHEFDGDSFYIFSWNNNLYRACNKPF